MRRISKIEIDIKAEKLYNDLIATYSLKGAKQVVMELKRLLLTETKRRKNLKG